MSSERDVAREIVSEQVLDATTLPEIEAARQALRDWIAAYPEEAEYLRDGFSQLSLLEEIAHTQEAEHAASQTKTITAP